MTKKKTLTAPDEKSIIAAQEEIRIAGELLQKRQDANANGKCPAFELDDETNMLMPKVYNKDIDISLAHSQHVLELMRLLNTEREGAAKTISNSLVSAQKNSTSLERELNGSIQLIEQIKPRDPVEAMLAVQMVATHHFAMELIGQSRNSTTNSGFDLKARHAERMLRIHSQQVSTLAKYRTGGKQTVEVKHVHVESGGQAIIGDIHAGR